MIVKLNDSEISERVVINPWHIIIAKPAEDNNDVDAIEVHMVDGSVWIIDGSITPLSEINQGIDQIRK